MEDIDFDPFEEGDVGINEPLTDEDYTRLLPRGKETQESWGARLARRTGRIGKALRDRMWANRNDLDASRTEYIPLLNREMAQDSAVEEVLRLYPEAKTSDFITAENEFGQVTIKLRRASAHAYVLQTNGERNPKLPKTLRDLLGPSTSDLAEKNEAEVAQNDAANQQDEVVLTDPQTSEADAVEARERIAQREQENEVLEEQTKALEKSMTLR
ncbi:hypothetical protein QZH41_001431 [Actinostola sp. cb2023]|nr:hypothetical protein QZH41_001431 [Actinostola sp. cb2023]